MGWKKCSLCGWTYNDAKGGCTNTACTACTDYVPPRSASTKSTATTTRVGGNVVPQPTPVIVPKPTTVMSWSQPKPPVHTVPKPTTGVSSSEVKPPVHDASSDPVVVPFINPTAPSKTFPIPPKAVVANGSPFTLNCYRGEKSEWWPPPKLRLVGGGMLLIQPWEWTSKTKDGKNVTSLFTKLAAEVRKQAGFDEKSKAKEYAQYLRAEGRSFAIATARTGGGSFTASYNYHIEIPNARTFSWGKNCTLGPPVDCENIERIKEERIVNKNVETFFTDRIKSDYIVLNADTLEDSSILAFGHKTGTFEVTFFTDLPLDMVVSCNGTATAALGILTKEQLAKEPDTPDKQKAMNLLRY
jgi:hypothetical protein